MFCGLALGVEGGRAVEMEGQRGREGREGREGERHGQGGREGEREDRGRAFDDLLDVGLDRNHSLQATGG